MGDIAVTASVDRDGKADFAIWRPSTGQWHGLLSGGGAMNVFLGQSGDVPIPGNYNVLEPAGPAIFRASSGLWYGVNASGSSVTQDIQGLGTTGDVPLPELPQ